MDSRRIGILAAVVAVVLLGGALRFHRLGDWPFHADELWTTIEADLLFDKPDPSLPVPIQRLPRVIPLSYLVHWVGYQCFGRDEWGSRALPALLGTLSLLLVAIGLSLAGADRGTALVTAVLLTLAPQHVYYSQQNRFYITAFFCASLCMVAGAIAVQRRSQGWMISACGLGLLALFTHTTLLVLLPGLLAAVLLAAWSSREGRLLPLAGIALIALLLGCGIYAVHARPLLSGWNSAVPWSYSPLTSLAATTFKLGWPLVLLAGLGAVLALTRRKEQDWYFLTWGAVCLGVCTLLPLLISYHPAYSFPFILGLFVLSAQGISHLAGRLAENSRVAAAVWVVIACLLNLPSLVSHFVDGSCSNYRAIAEHIRAHWQPGDRVMATSPQLLEHYLANGTDPLALALYEPEAALKELAEAIREPGRLWIAVNYGRGNRPTVQLDWLGKNCTRQLDIAPVRYDAFEYPTTLFLHECHGPANSPQPPITHGRASLP